MARVPSNVPHLSEPAANPADPTRFPAGLQHAFWFATFNALSFPIVIGSPAAYPIIWRYSPAELRARLHCLSDLSWGAKQRDPLGELTLVAEQPFVPFKLEPYDAFLAANRKFYLYCDLYERETCGDPTAWIKRRLVQEGADLTLLAKTKRDVLYLVTVK